MTECHFSRISPKTTQMSTVVELSVNPGATRQRITFGTTLNVMIDKEGDEKILSEFVEKLVEEKGLVHLEPEVREQMEVDLRDRLESLIHARIIEEIGEEKLPEFEKLLDGNASPKETQQFIQDSIPDHANFLAGVLLDFRRAYLG